MHVRSIVHSPFGVKGCRIRLSMSVPEDRSFDIDAILCVGGGKVIDSNSDLLTYRLKKYSEITRTMKQAMPLLLHCSFILSQARPL